MTNFRFNHKISLQSLLSLLLATIISFPVLASPAQADEDYLDYYAENEIFYYDPKGYIAGGSNIVCALDEDGQGSNTTYSGKPVLGDGYLDNVKEGSELREIYDKISEETGIPWQIFATIHYMESGMSMTSPNAFGYTPDGENNGFGDVVYSTEDQLRYVANNVIKPIIEGQKNGKPLDLSNENDVKRLFFYYNSEQWVGNPAGSDRLRDQQTGQLLYDAKGIPLYKADPKGDWQRGELMYSAEDADNGEGSIYVMNMADSKRDPNSPEVDSLWLTAGDQWWSDHPGAFLVYQALGGGGFCQGIPTGGITDLESARAFVQTYIDDMRSDNWSLYLDADAYSYGQEKYSGYGGDNCVTYVKYYLAKYLGINLKGVSTGNGKDVAKFLINNYDFQEISQPEEGAVFSYNTSGGFGHTGIILGVDPANDKIYLAQAALDEGLEWGIQDENLERSLSEFLQKPDLVMAKYNG